MAWQTVIQVKERASDARRVNRRQLELGVEAIAMSSEPIVATVKDLSETGLLLETSDRVELGTELELRLPEAGPTRANVVWVSGDFVGCQFIQPVSRGTVSSVLLKTPPSARRQETTPPASQAAPNELLSPSHDEDDDKFGPASRIAVIVGSSLTLWAGLFTATRSLMALL